MKLKYRNSEFFFAQICLFILIISFLLCLLASNLYESIQMALIFSVFVVLPFTFFCLKYLSFNTFKRKVINKGRKRHGYIIGSCYWPRTFIGFYGLRGFVDGRTFDIYEFRGTSYGRSALSISGFSHCDGILNNSAYKYICSEFEKVEDIGNGKFKLRSFPIDVYVYKDKYYFDLESVKLDK